MNEQPEPMDKSLWMDAIRCMLLCRMPETMRNHLEALIAQPNVSTCALKSAYEGYAKRLVLSRPRQEIQWNPTVDAWKCIGCEECYHFCPHSVFRMEAGVATVEHPSECVILCSNCMPRCPVKAISFPPQKKYVEFLCYE